MFDAIVYIGLLGLVCLKNQWLCENSVYFVLDLLLTGCIYYNYLLHLCAPHRTRPDKFVSLYMKLSSFMILPHLLFSLIIKALCPDILV